MTVIDLAGRTPAQKQGLLSQLFVPRPIAMISTLDEDGGLNVAPFSYYMPISGEPPMLAVTVGALHESGRPKDTWLNLQRTGEFVINVTTIGLSEHIETVAREYPRGVSEAEIAGWNACPRSGSSRRHWPRVPPHLECVVREVIDRGDQLSCFSGVHIVLAEVMCITSTTRSRPSRTGSTPPGCTPSAAWDSRGSTRRENSVFALERTPYQRAADG